MIKSLYVLNVADNTATSVDTVYVILIEAGDAGKLLSGPYLEKPTKGQVKDYIDNAVKVDDREKLQWSVLPIDLTQIATSADVKQGV